jgi:WD40 repeat protein
VWTVLASASEDATVKIWDWEGGEMERSVKGHTKGVMDVDFDGKGGLMGECCLDAEWVIGRSISVRSELRGKSGTKIGLAGGEGTIPPRGIF